MIRRLAVVTALGMLSAVLFSAAPASAAGAADDQFGVFSAGSPAAHVGDLTVVLGTPNGTQISAVTAHLTTAGTAGDVLDPALTQTATAPYGSSETQTTWSVAAPLTVAQLPLGSYSISVDVTFADQTTQSAANIGTLGFLNEPVLTLTADHTDVGYDYPAAINLTGTAAILAPDGTSTPYAGTLALTTNFGPGQTLTADAAGDFTGQVSTQIGNWIDVSLAAAPGQAERTAIVILTPVTDPLKLSARLSPNPIRYGTAQSVTGTLSYLPFAKGTAYKPLAGQPVKVYDPYAPNPNAPVASGTTNASGGFSFKMPSSFQRLNPWAVEAGGEVGDYLFKSATATVTTSVVAPSAITNFHVTLSQYWELSFSGCLNVAAKSPVSVMSTGGLVFQYSTRGPNGPWRTLVKSVPQGSSACRGRGVWFAWTAAAPLNYAYYRAYYGGSANNPGVLPSASRSLLVWKYADRIAGFSISPHTVGNGGRLTVKGQLQVYSDYKWHDYANQTVFVIFRPKGTDTWYWEVRVKTNSSGRFSASFTEPDGSATWSAQFNGNSSHLATAPPGVYVRVSG